MPFSIYPPFNYSADVSVEPVSEGALSLFVPPISPLPSAGTSSSTFVPPPSFVSGVELLLFTVPDEVLPPELVVPPYVFPPDVLPPDVLPPDVVLLFVVVCAPLPKLTTISIVLVLSISSPGSAV